VLYASRAATAVANHEVLAESCGAARRALDRVEQLGVELREAAAL
jgi:hypothetical protein